MIWRYTEGVKASTKRKENDDEKKFYQKQDDEKRVRQFDPKWQEKREWLVNTKDGMQWSVCIDAVFSEKLAPPVRKNLFMSGMIK